MRSCGVNFTVKVNLISKIHVPRLGSRTKSNSDSIFLTNIQFTSIEIESSQVHRRTWWPVSTPIFGQWTVMDYFYDFWCCATPTDHIKVRSSKILADVSCHVKVFENFELDLIGLNVDIQPFSNSRIGQKPWQWNDISIGIFVKTYIWNSYPSNDEVMHSFLLRRNCI